MLIEINFTKNIKTDTEEESDTLYDFFEQLSKYADIMWWDDDLEVYGLIKDSNIDIAEHFMSYSDTVYMTPDGLDQCQYILRDLMVKYRVTLDVTLFGVNAD